MIAFAVSTHHGRLYNTLHSSRRLLFSGTGTREAAKAGATITTMTTRLRTYCGNVDDEGFGTVPDDNLPQEIVVSAFCDGIDGGDAIATVGVRVTAMPVLHHDMDDPVPVRFDL